MSENSSPADRDEEFVASDDSGESKAPKGEVGEGVGRDKGHKDAKGEK